MSAAEISRFIRPARVGITVVGVGFLALALLTTPSLERDAFDSAVYSWGWVGLPLLAAVGTMWGFERSAAAWSIALVAPFALWALVAGTFLHDPDSGASFWLVGEMFLAAMAGVVYAGSAVGAAIGQSLAKRRSRRCSSCATLLTGTDRFCPECGSKVEDG